MCIRGPCIKLVVEPSAHGSYVHQTMVRVVSYDNIILQPCTYSPISPIRRIVDCVSDKARQPGGNRKPESNASARTPWEKCTHNGCLVMCVLGPSGDNDCIRRFTTMVETGRCFPTEPTHCACKSTRRHSCAMTKSTVAGS